MTIPAFFSLVADRATRAGLTLDGQEVVRCPLGAITLGMRCDFSDNRRKASTTFDADLLDMDDQPITLRHVIDDELENLAISLKAMRAV